MRRLYPHFAPTPITASKAKSAAYLAVYILSGEHMISVEEALQLVLDSAAVSEKRTVSIHQALGCTLAQDVLADRPLPPFNRVAMDGYAVKSSDFTSATVTLKHAGGIAAGDEFDRKLQSGEAYRIMTGAPCPEGADAVVKIEHCKREGEWVVITEENIKPGLNIATKGEDASKGKLLLPAGTVLNTSGIAICASVGLTGIPVYRKPEISVISTGTEIIPPDQDPLPHQVRDCNSFSARSLSKMLGIDARFLGIGEDDTTIQKKMIQEGLKSDILILSGGVSMGDYDLIPGLLAECGVKRIFHVVKMKPGKPIWFGKTDGNTYVFGLPGNPVSVQIGYKLLVETLIRKITGNASPEPAFLMLELHKPIAVKASRETFVPGRFEVVNGRSVVTQVRLQGSGDFSNVAASHGLIRCPTGVSNVKSGTYVQFLPWIRFN